MATTTPKTTSASRRRTVIPAWTHPRDRLAYLWLALAIVLLPFATVRWTIPLAAWLYPIFLLRFVRTQPLLRGILLVLLAIVLVFAFVWQGVIPLPGAFYYLVIFYIGVLYTLPYLIDRVVVPRLGGMLGTLVFPLATTTVWYLNGLLNSAEGTFGNPAYTQYGNLPLLQLLSVTGLWGIVFVMSWLASVVNWAWERGFAWPRVRGGAALYASLLALVLLFGGVRLALFPAQASTVRVAGISPSQAVIVALDRQLSRSPAQPWNELSALQQRLILGKSTQADRELFHRASVPVFDELLARSEQEARAGAKIILWSECRVAEADDILQEDVPVLLARASVLARTTGTYLDLNMCVLLSHPVQSRFALDQITLIDPSGNVVWRYEKAHPVPGEPEAPGDGQVPTVQTPYGRLSSVICYDTDFLDTIRRTGQAGADVMLVPGGDWPEIDPYHTQMATFRAIENGYSLVRHADQGLSMAVDYEGNVLAASDYFTTDPQVMVAYVPMQGVHTIYATIGDLFAWLSLAGLLVLIGVALARRRTAGEAGAAAPITASPAGASPSEAVPASKKSSMLLFHRRHFPAQHIGSALFSVVFLVSLLLPTLEIAPVQAMHSTPPPPSATGLSDPRELEAFLSGVLSVQLAENHIPGATVSIVKDGRLFFAKGYGEADLQAGKPVSAQTTLFRVGSVSKLFTATAVLQLAEQGKLNLHADVNTYLKTFHIPATYPEPITLAHLLTHTAGFEDRETGYDARTISDLEPLGQWLAEHIPARVRPPGELTAYSNYGFTLAGYIVEQVSGMPFDQYVEQHLFQPLNMRSSTFRQPLPASLSAALSQGYTYTNGVYRPGPFELLQTAPGGAMSATATDIANFMLAQLQNGRLGTERILQAATVKEMQTQQFTNDPRVSGMAYGFQEQYLNSQRLLVKDGDVNGFHSLLALLPEHQVGVFISYNGGSWFVRNTFLQAFLDHYFPTPKVTLPPPPAGFAERISQLSGTYWPTRRSYTTYEKLWVFFLSATSVTDGGNGHLLLSSGGQTWTFRETAPWVFHQVDGPETLVFRADPNGMLMVIGNDPTVAFIKGAWYDTPFFHLVLVVACVVLFLSTLLWPLGFVRRVMRRDARSKQSGPNADREGEQAPPQAKPGKPPLSRMDLLPVLASWLTGVLCALNVLCLGLGPSSTSNGPDLVFGVTPLLSAVFILALVSAFLTMGVVVFALLAWWGRFWSVGRRVHYSLIALAALAFVWELAYWNLLGFRA